jgi:hypothetical protein
MIGVSWPENLGPLFPFWMIVVIRVLFTSPIWLPLLIALVVVCVNRRFSLAALLGFVTIEAIGLGVVLWIARSIPLFF